ncbi:MAG TPA: MerR family transcriptional regulator [Acidimicrobiales bacterium]
MDAADDRDEPLLTIGEVARRAGVPTSTVRFYERRGLLEPDARRSGQRRYRMATLRRLVFIGMLQDAGLSLDDIAGILGAADAAEWKAIGRRRLAALDAEIARLQEAREYLAGALHCRYDHPATECQIMGMEIDRRLARTADPPPDDRPPPGPAGRRPPAGRHRGDRHLTAT